MKFDRTKALNEEEILPELKPLQADFLKDRFADLEKIRVLVENKQFEEVAKIAHNWKGFCAPYGFPFLAQMAEAIEAEIKNGDSIDSEAFVQGIQEYLEFKEKNI